MTAYTMTTPVETRTLVAATADTATLQGGYAAVMVLNQDTTNFVYVRADGTAAAVATAGSFPVPPRTAITIPLVYGQSGSSPTVSVISSSTPTYSVMGVLG